MNSRMTAAMLACMVAIAPAAGAAGGQMNHAEHMRKLGDQAMGFDVAHTTHHFRLTPTGGTIQVHVNDASDTALREQVATHLKMIAGQFSRGDFDTPLAVHGETPAGVPALKRLNTDITYRFEPDAAGGRVEISTASDAARAAIHEFLRYQIREHHTGDPMEVQRPPSRKAPGTSA